MVTLKLFTTFLKDIHSISLNSSKPFYATGDFNLFSLSFFRKIFLWFLYPGCVSICQDLQNTIILSSALLYKLLHLQYNLFAIYDELKAVSQTPSHDKLLHLYWNHIWYRCPHSLYNCCICHKTFPKWNTSEGLHHLY